MRTRTMWRGRTQSAVIARRRRHGRRLRETRGDGGEHDIAYRRDPWARDVVDVDDPRQRGRSPRGVADAVSLGGGRRAPGPHSNRGIVDPGMNGAPRSSLVRALVVMFLVSIAAVRTAYGQVPTAADVAACNDEAPAVVKIGAASPTTNDHARAKGARDGSPAPVADPQIHGMNGEGAKDATYQAAYRSCMRRKGF